MPVPKRLAGRPMMPLSMPERPALANDRLGIAAEEHLRGRMQALWPVALSTVDDVQQVGIVALLGGRQAPCEALELVGVFVLEIQFCPETADWRPRSHRCGAVGHPGRRGISATRVLPERMVAVGKSCRIMFMVRQTGGGHVLFLAFQVMCLLASAATLSRSCRNCRWGHRRWWRPRCLLEDADHSPGIDQPAHLGRGVELALGLAHSVAAAHQVLAGVAEDVVVLGPVLEKSSSGFERWRSGW